MNKLASIKKKSITITFKIYKLGVVPVGCVTVGRGIEIGQAGCPSLSRIVRLDMRV